MAYIAKELMTNIFLHVDLMYMYVQLKVGLLCNFLSWGAILGEGVYYTDPQNGILAL